MGSYHRPDLVNVSAFLQYTWTIQQAQLLPDGFWRYRLGDSWPLLALASEQQQAKGAEAVKSLLPFLDAETQLSIAEQVAEAIRECVEQPDETLQKRLFTAIRARVGLDELLPQLVPLANRMGLTVADLVDAHIEAIRYGAPDGRQLEYTVDELQDLLTVAEGLVDHGDRLARLLWPLADATWPSDSRVLGQARQLLELVLDRWSKSSESFLAGLSVILFLKLLSYDAQIQQIVPRLFTTLSRTEPLKLGLWHISEVLGELSSECLSELGAFLTHEDEAVRTGATMFWKTVVDAAIYYRRPLGDELQKVKNIRLVPEVGLALIRDNDASRRLEGIALLTLSDYPVEDLKCRRILLDALQKPQNAEEEEAWARLLREIPMSDERRSKWCNLLEEILDEPQSYGNMVLSAAMERYQRLANATDVAFSGIKERELGLP